jgi:hypothetical protein
MVRWPHRRSVARASDLGLESSLPESRSSALALQRCPPRVTRRFRRTSTFRNPRWVLGSAGDEEFEEAHARLVTGVLTIPFVMQDPRA